MAVGNVKRIALRNKKSIVNKEMIEIGIFRFFK